MAQITSVTSEALQATLRRLLPSQQGFGEDLQASNVITPIIDLTPTAEGSVLGTNLQTALAFGSQTAYEVENGSTTIANVGGFYRVIGVSTFNQGASADFTTRFFISDGATTVVIWKHRAVTGGYTSSVLIPSTTQFDFSVFLRSGDSLIARSGSTSAILTGSIRQIADISGNLINPSGFTAE